MPEGFLMYSCLIADIIEKYARCSGWSSIVHSPHSKGLPGLKW